MLQDLQKLGAQLQHKYLGTYQGQDKQLPLAFKQMVNEIDGSSIVYNDYSFVVTINLSAQKIFFPNQLWYIAACFADYYKALSEYTRIVKVDLHLTDTEIKQAKDNQDFAETLLANTTLADEEKSLVAKFLSDYAWWYGGKGIERADFHISPILALCKLVNASQGYVADLCKFLAKNDKALQLLKNEISDSGIIKTLSTPLQQIFYGAPGTGKSHGVKMQTAGVPDQFIFRTTFHPDSDYSTFVGAYKPTMTKKAVRNVAGDIVKESGVEVYEPSIVYTFVPQAFLKAYVAAWKNQEQPVFLVIEEINRGNCAQIFGDIFQLLDRDDNGVSEYPIKADQDIQNYLAEVFADCDTLPENIKSGEELVLPSNLHIWATMNTSDQSLFPIDSAFKRRWDWKYVPIAKPDDLDVHIQVGSNEYDWWEFLDTINNHIGKITSSEDKKLGYFFCKACKDDKISTDKFVNKVIFYLWNDVFKDYEVSHEAFKDGTKQLSFAKFFKEDGNANEKTIEKFLQDLGLEPIENILEDSGNEEETMSAEQTADIEQKRYDFWQSFLDYSKNNQEFKELFKRDKPSKVHWYTYGVFKNAKCSMCIEQVRRENKFVISFNTTKEIFTKISEYKDEINAKLNGLDLVWMQDLPRSKKESKVVNTFHVNNFEDPTERTQLFEHTIDTLLKMQKVFMEYLQKISQ